jgi:hypothetical protein
VGELQGKRVEGMEAVWDGEPGVYWPKLTEDGRVECLWFKLPTGVYGRINGKGFGGKPNGVGGVEPEWDITVNEDGTVTVDPSIEMHETPGDPPTPYWHGHLVNGVWRD